MRLSREKEDDVRPVSGLGCSRPLVKVAWRQSLAKRMRMPLYIDLERVMALRHRLEYANYFEALLQDADRLLQASLFYLC